MNYRLYTRIIILKDGQYLLGRTIFGELKYGTSPWDAWWTRDREAAERVADAIGGTMILFNPVLGRVRLYNGGQRHDTARENTAVSG